MNKVYTIGELNNYPFIRISGKWLKENGFEIGDKIQLSKSKGILLLVKMTNKENK